MSTEQVLATTVVRGAQRGQRHGAMYRVDLPAGPAELVLEWSDPTISWEGAGGDRGLRGIATTDDAVFVGAAQRILALDHSFELRDTITNPYLHHVHELARSGDRLWVASTGCDSLVALDVSGGRFTVGLCLRVDDRGQVVYEYFDPESSVGPTALDSIHLNNVVADDGRVFASARDWPLMIAVADDEIRQWATIPLGTHNPRPFRDGLLYSDTPAGCAVRAGFFGNHLASYRPGPFDGLEPTDNASPGFVRGLCVSGDSVIVGASPASLWLFDPDSGALRNSIALERDMHHAVASIVPWPGSR